MTGRRTACAALAVLAVLTLSACEKIDRNMWETPAYKPQEEPVRLPPPDSVPTKGRERILPMQEAAKLPNPVKPAEGALGKGKELFGIFCSPCHGVTGKGDGPVGKKFVSPPTDLRASSPAAQAPDGVLFVIVSKGAGAMPAFRADLTPEERWQVIAYLRTLDAPVRK